MSTSDRTPESRPLPPRTAAPGLPQVVDRETWEAARAELLVEEKAHTRAGDALAAKRRRLPMVEVPADAVVVGRDGPVPFLDLFAGRDALVTYGHMWWDGAPHQGQCEGCTLTAWHLRDAAYLEAAGVSFAILTSGQWEEVAPFLEFMGYTQPWYSAREAPAPIGGDMGYLRSFVRQGDRVFLTYETTGRGVESRTRPSPCSTSPPTVAGRRGRTLPRAGRRGTRPAGTGARTSTAPPPGDRRADRSPSGPAPVRRRRAPWDGRATITERAEALGSLARIEQLVEEGEVEVVVSDPDGVLRVFDPALWRDLDGELGARAGTSFGAILGHPLLEEVTRGRASHAQWREAARHALREQGVDAAAAERAVERWAGTPGRPDPEVTRALERIRAGGTPVFVLTNGTDRVRAELEEIGLAPALGPGWRWLLNTADLGAAKPEREAFARAHARIEQELGRSVLPGRVVFLDDSPRHVAGAEAFGWQALVHPAAPA